MSDPPVEDAVETTLANGLRVSLRPVVPEDSEALAEGMRALSARSRYLRFFSGKGRLSEAAVRYLTDLDYVDHFAWVAIDAASPDDSGMAIARYIRPEPGSDSAEIAVTVGDEYQGQGLGRLLVDALVLVARDNGVTHLTATVLSENRAMQSILRRVGMKLRFSPEDSALLGSCELASLPVDDTDVARALRASARAAREHRRAADEQTVGWPTGADPDN